MRLAFALILLSLSQPAATAAGDGFPTLADGEILVLGEMHGSNEIPRYFLEQVRREARLRPVTVGLEVSPSSAALDCRRDDPRRLPSSWTRGAQDGRSSRAMRDLLCGLRAPALARRVRIAFLDDEQRGDDFDRRAAARFRRVLAESDGIGMILTGNFHSRNNPGSLAAELRRLGANVRTVTVSAPVAETWVCTGQPSTCGARRTNINFCSGDPADGRDPRWQPVADPRFAWDYCLSLPRLTPSLPAMTRPS